MELARRFDAEIVGADSRQVYRGMPIGTAAPTEEQTAQVRHHLVGFVDPRERYSAARYANDALDALADIRARYDQLAAETLAKKRASRRTLGLLSNLGGLLAAVESLERDQHHHPRDHHRPRVEDRAA